MLNVVLQLFSNYQMNPASIKEQIKEGKKTTKRDFFSLCGNQWFCSGNAACSLAIAINYITISVDPNIMHARIAAFY